MHLLDVNVLIALVDRDHIHHVKTRHWFLQNARNGWATCPITENGLIRIVGHRNYPGGSGSSDMTRALLSRLCAEPGHLFWADSISLNEICNYPKLPASKHLTDYYLLALAIENRGRFATLDQRIDPELVQGGEAAYHLID